MKKQNLLILLAALSGLCGCASFNSGDIRVERSAARAMLEDRGTVPFSEIQVSWQNFPYRAATDSIGEGSFSNPKKIMPVPVPGGDSAEFARKAREIFSAAGLYDKAKGRGALRLKLTSFGRWTYSDLFGSYLVDTGFIFIIPSSLRVNYQLTADFATSTGTIRVEEIAQNKTTFHILMAPLYPFFAPGPRENGLLKQLLWRTASDTYARLKAAGGVPVALPAQQPTPPERAVLPSPPMTPDKSWLPGKPLESEPYPAQEPPSAEPPSEQNTPAAPVSQTAPDNRPVNIEPAPADETPDD